jgi:hypothetical protein
MLVKGASIKETVLAPDGIRGEADYLLTFYKM